MLHLTDGVEYVAKSLIVVICWFGFARVVCEYCNKGVNGSFTCASIQRHTYTNLYIFQCTLLYDMLSILWLRLPLKDGLMVHAVCGCAVLDLYTIYVIVYICSSPIILVHQLTFSILILYIITCAVDILGNETANGNFPSFHIITVI